MTGLGPTLLLALAGALVLGAIAHRLRLPPMIGYVAAGLAVGPFTPGPVAPREEVFALADIGVALLMFSIGLHFSVRELLAMGRPVLLGTPIQVAIAVAAGAGLGLLFGWPLIEALFVGAALAICSSVVLVKLAGERTLQGTLHGRLAIGISIMQDLLTVLIVVILSALATGSDDLLLDTLRSGGLALGFLLLVVVVGSRVLPPLLARVAALGSRELFVIAIAVLAVGTAFSATLVGVSIALGAFVAGLAVSESDLTASVLGEIVPLRELFSTVFFVSVGILLLPSALVDGLAIIALLLVVIVLGKLLPVAAIGMLSGSPASTAFRAGGMISQSGEFSFVIATVGLGLGAIEREVFSLAMWAVVLSIVLAAPVSAAAGRLGDAIDRAGVGHRVRAGADLAGIPRETTDAVAAGRTLRRHAVVLGYGRVGRTVCRVLEGRQFSYVAVDADYGLVRRYRERGAPLIYGDAGSPSVLDEARIGEASTLIVAVPDPLAAHQAVEYAHRHNPRIEIIARAHSESEEALLRRHGVSRVVVAERQVGNELVRHALARFGVSEAEIAAILQRRRE
jgi:CPA2 family monovalent cation:H+ antiporter-2